MDPLSDVLSLLKPRNTMCGGFDVGGEWSLQFPPSRRPQWTRSQTCYHF
jgi:hypothetical protein